MRIARATRQIIIAGAMLLGIAPAVIAAKSPKTLPADSLSMAVGTTFGHDIAMQLDRLRSLGIAVDLDVFARAMNDQLHHRSGIFTPDEAEQWLDRYIAATRPEELPDVLSDESQKAFLDSVAALPGAVILPDGLILFVEREGEGPMPADNNKVSIVFTGRFYNGQEFDASTTPIEFGVGGLVPGFSEGLKQMKPGGRYRLVIPPSLAYGPQGIEGAIPGNAVLDFDIELIEIK